MRAAARVLATALVLGAGLGVGCGPEPGPVAPDPAAAGDGCGRCHAADEGPAGVHTARALGCSGCHLGDPAGETAAAAHAGLEREPGALDTVDHTCGSTNCHAAQAARVATSLMATGRGLLAVDREAFGEQPLPHGDETWVEVLALADPSPSRDHARRLCGGCHLHTRRDNRDDAVSGTGSGCSACHSAARAGRWDAHPGVDLVVGDDRCLGCHSRSGRISLSYQGLAEVKGPVYEAACAEPLPLHDGRPGCRRPDDAHHAAGLACADCHLHTELMGDGTAWTHEEEATELRCATCHGPDAPTTTWGAVEDPTSRTLVRLHGQVRDPAEPVRLGSRGTPVWNLRGTAEGGWTLDAKGGDRSWAVPPTPADPTHTQAGHGRLACQACHAAWAPLCADCHTSFDPAGRQWDFGRGAEAAGAWVERSVHFGWGAPALGVSAQDRIGPVVPGMIWTLDHSGETRTARRFAASRPHTTARQGRSCASCHAEPAALGLGTGTLDLVALRFTPAVPAPGVPGLAVDGWVVLQPATPGEGTRPGLRSLDADEQRRVLRVGLCVGCHAAADDAIYADFGAALRRRAAGGPRCRGDLPGWAHPRTPGPATP